MVKKTRMGKISVPLDVRDENDVPAFEKMLEHGPMMIVLVYADWCGHCTKYKDNVWSPLKSVKNRTMNMASVHYDQLENTSLKNSKIEGYPSLLVVGKDKTPATFKSSSGTTTNALPKANDFTTMKNLATSTVVENDKNELVMNSLPKISSSLKPSTLQSEETTSESTMNDETTPELAMNQEVTPELPMSQETTSELPASDETETVPKISEDVVTLTNSMNKTANLSPFSSSNTRNSMNKTANLSPSSASNTTSTRVAMMGGRLYRMLSLKKKRRGSSKKRKNTRKTAKF